MIRHRAAFAIAFAFACACAKTTETAAPETGTTSESGTTDTGMAAKCIPYDAPPHDASFPYGGDRTGILPSCVPRCGVGRAYDGFFYIEALPSGSCRDEPPCELAAVVHCGCADGRGPVNGYRCSCESGAWQCKLVGLPGGSICLPTTCNDAATPDGETSVGDSGPCGAGRHVAYTAPGCTAEPGCLPDGPEDACASMFCGCDGKTFSGACGYSPKPFAAKGPCGEPLKECAADRLPVEATACTMANGTYCRLRSCNSGCEDECACRDGVWKCTKSCRDWYGCGAAPSCADTCVGDGGGG